MPFTRRPQTASRATDIRPVHGTRLGSAERISRSEGQAATPITLLPITTTTSVRSKADALSTDLHVARRHGAEQVGASAEHASADLGAGGLCQPARRHHRAQRQPLVPVRERRFPGRCERPAATRLGSRRHTHHLTLVLCFVPKLHG